ncbi:NAD(P)H-dependent glycerol-3-phosphate dehydrogenase [Carboxydothermus hydrogenoformans]|uniref:Glycerol-3-phosphate dehydrogenase [NAD(P)+] n=1 Tax=Carboxydothermus hydrogenoformans (strain ATCC BAA-161 / DSM 6008 / Z-2901) TaxID=246194 RepID=GPDA_CARHZ|nr:RecName: Full=Glycerol-3-phosphate dehydrogenase [NAD(P)+]; AltName: Full=NAD(P)H-dependent glycerol-3-phosphate dehydrogenase [Carboxydothermus hydrogenoformans Z-2901]ABB14125.1 glycerol-3-phosphate dehydrogenase (NAD(P)+) [Carboxydothermus hydrogenoformans Z-2901]
MGSIKVTVLGAGSWGTALSNLLAQKGVNTVLWGRDSAVIEEINRERENKRYLPGVKISQELIATADLEFALKDANFLVAAVPSQAFRDLLQKIKPYFKPEQILVNTAKGIEEGSLLRMSAVFTEVLPEYRDNYTILSGPSHAEEVGRGIPTAIVVSGYSPEKLYKVQELFSTEYFRVYTNDDLTGVELGGSLKNIIAIASGICTGLGLGDNTRAALVTRGLIEITRLGIKLGAKKETFMGLSGLGDLFVTAGSRHSRNYKAGILIGEGKSLEETQKEINMVVEGIRTTRAAYQLAQRLEVEMPITEALYKVLFAGLPPREGLFGLMTRAKKEELNF